MYSLTVMMGRLVEDPELRHTPNGVAVSSFRIAVDRSYKVNGEKIADFFTVVAWRVTAEFVCKYFRKGKPVLVQGSFQNRDYTKNDGSKGYATELIADEVHFAGDSSGKEERSLPDPPPERGAAAKANSSSNTPEGFDEVPSPSDDDLPF
jgi:single-strand DNA-binding protein